MTRREYLTALNQYLVTMSESEKMKILKEYDDHFREGYEAGKTESQICASLGAPYDVANEFIEGRRPKVPTYPEHSRPQTAQPRQQASSSSTDYIGSGHRQTSAPRTGAAQSRPQTTQPRPQPSSYSAPVRQEIFEEPMYAPQQQSYSAPTYAPQQQSYSAPTYAPQQQSYSAPTYAPQQQSYSAPTRQPSYPQNSSAYVDYDREAEDREPEPKKKKHESKYSTTGVIVVAVIGVLLVPTMGFAIYYLVRGLYELIRAFPGTGIALIVAGGSFSADSLWICLGLIFIGLSFLALTGLLIMAIIEITKLFVKLFRYVIKECKKMIKEGSF